MSCGLHVTNSTFAGSPKPQLGLGRSQTFYVFYMLILVEIIFCLRRSGSKFEGNVANDITHSMTGGLESAKSPNTPSLVSANKVEDSSDAESESQQKDNAFSSEVASQELEALEGMSQLKESIVQNALNVLGKVEGIIGGDDEDNNNNGEEDVEKALRSDVHSAVDKVEKIIDEAL